MDDKLLELIEKMYSDLKNEISSVKQDLSNEISSVKQDLSNEISSVNQELSNEISSVNQELSNEISSVKQELSNEIRTVSNHVLKLENDLYTRTEALFDGYRQNTETLERIEKEVSKQEEIIMRRVK